MEEAVPEELRRLPRKSPQQIIEDAVPEELRRLPLKPFDQMIARRNCEMAIYANIKAAPRPIDFIPDPEGARWRFPFEKPPKSSAAGKSSEEPCKSFAGPDEEPPKSSAGKLSEEPRKSSAGPAVFVVANMLLLGAYLVKRAWW